MSKPPFWTADRVAQLTDLYCVRGETCEAIAAIMGSSKNAIIGKIHCAGLVRGAGVLLTKYQVAGHNQRQLRQASTILTRLAALDVFPPTGRCVYPIGHPKSEAFHFCGDRVTDIGAPYCHDHNRKCWQGAGSAKQREAWENDPERRLKAAAHARKIAAAKQRGAA